MPDSLGQPIYSKPSEADTCRKYVVPKLQAAGWDTEPHSLAEQRTFTAGRIVVAGTKATRQEPKRADYLLRYAPDFTIAVVEAKPEDALPGGGHRILARVLLSLGKANAVIDGNSGLGAVEDECRLARPCSLSGAESDARGSGRYWLFVFSH